MVLIVGDEYDGGLGERSVGFDGLQNVHSIAVILVELAVDEDEVKLPSLQLSQSVIRAMRLHHFRAERPLDKRTNGPVIWNAITDIENAFGHRT